MTFINGQQRDYDGMTLLMVLDHMRIPPDRVVVEHNGRIIKREAYETTTLMDRDRVEIVRFVGGG